MRILIPCREPISKLSTDSLVAFCFVWSLQVLRFTFSLSYFLSFLAPIPSIILPFERHCKWNNSTSGYCIRPLTKPNLIYIIYCSGTDSKMLCSITYQLIDFLFLFCQKLFTNLNSECMCEKSAMNRFLLLIKHSWNF